jgi:hypothetical protein
MKFWLRLQLLTVWILFIAGLIILRITMNDKLTNYESMQPWDLLTIQLRLETEISNLTKQKKEVQALRDRKTAEIRWETGTSNGAIEQVNKELGLE